MRQRSAPPPILTVRIQFQTPSPSQTSPQPDTQPAAVDPRPERQITAIMTDEEIVRRLKTVKHSSQFERLAKRLPSINSIANETGFTTRWIYLVIAGDRPLTKASRNRFGRYFSALDCDMQPSHEQIDGETNAVRRPR
jgi:hypothetical protein